MTFVRPLVEDYGVNKVLCFQTAGGTFALDEKGTKLLSDYFLERRDKELGRWRSAEYPNWVVYPARDNPNQVTVVNERNGNAWWAYRSRKSVAEHDEVAHAYFDSQPFAKPWHTPKEAEVWALKFDGYGKDYEQAFRVGISGNKLAFISLTDVEALAVLPTDHRIRNARKIWPES